MERLATFNRRIDASEALKMAMLNNELPRTFLSRTRYYNITIATDI